ncbi:MAG: hypothetical protein R3C11_19580 [Planctomycetaceae bacterium]
MENPVRTMTRKRGREWENPSSFYFFAALFLIGCTIALFPNESFSLSLPLGGLGLVCLISAIGLHRRTNRKSVVRYELFEEHLTAIFRNGDIKIFRFGDVTKLSWPISSPNKFDQVLCVTIETQTETFFVPLDALSLSNQRHLILTLRRKIPVELQEFWEPYFETRGYRILEKQKLSPAEIVRLKSSGIIFSTRKYYDRGLLRLFCSVTIAAGIGGISMGHPWFLLFGLTVLLFGLPYRFVVPKYESERYPDFASPVLAIVLFFIILLCMLSTGVLMHLEQWINHYPQLKDYDPLLRWISGILLVGSFWGPVVLFIYLLRRNERSPQKQLEKQKTEARLRERQDEVLDRYRIRDEDLK